MPTRKTIKIILPNKTIKMKVLPFFGWKHIGQHILDDLGHHTILSIYETLSFIGTPLLLEYNEQRIAILEENDIKIFFNKLKESQ